MTTQGQLSNHLLGNKYLLGDLLGYGGFGEVYRAQNTLLNRPQAIKVILEKHLGDPKFRERFLHEARTLAALNHPNIVHVDDFELEEERAYLVMPFIEGGTLHSLLVKAESLSLPNIREYLKQICLALDYAHAQHVVHLDLKPRNLLHHNGILLLSDFGLAHMMKQGKVEGGTSLRRSFGSPFYMAPEQIQGKPEARSDIYALGIILYQMLTGHLPFEESVREAILLKHLTELPPPLREGRPDLPPPLEIVINKALAKDPIERYATAGELLQAFLAALTTNPLLPVRPVDSLMGSPVPQSKMPLPPDITGQQHDVSSNSTRSDPFATDPFTSQSNTNSFSKPQVPPKGSISRRTVITGLGTLAGAGIAGAGIVLLVRSHQPGALADFPSPTVPPTLAPTSLTPSPAISTLYIYRGHTDAVQAVAWSPDGKRIASTSVDETVQVWDAANGAHVFTYRGHTSGVFAVAWSPDGQRIASGSIDGTVQIWDAANGGHVFTYRGHTSALRAIVWSPDGTRIASGGYDTTVQVWNAGDGGNAYVYKGHSDWIFALTWSPDSKRIASASRDTTVQVWDASDGSHTFTFREQISFVEAVAWSPDGTRITSGGDQSNVLVWDAPNGGHTFTFTAGSGLVLTLDWSPNSKRIVSGNEGYTAQVWDATNGGHLFTYGGFGAHVASVNAVKWSPDGTRIASGSNDHTVHIWQDQ